MDSVRRERLALIYSDAWKARLRAFVSRKYHNFGDWQGWFEEAHQNLAMKVDRLPVDREINDAMIFAVFKNELISVKRHRLGYPRPRQWLREFSELGQDLFEWMCLQHMLREQTIIRAVEKSREAEYKNSHTENSASGSFRELLENLTRLMIEKKECDGVRPGTDSVDSESVAQIATDEPSTEDNTEHEQLSVVLAMILGTDQITNSIQQKAVERLASMRSALQETPLLTDLDVLVLRCYYFQGMSQNDIARLIKQPLQKIVRRREAAVKRIREFMEKFGLDRQALL